MIRRRDYLRLTAQKLGLRKKRAAFAIISVALGVIVVVTANSLLEGVRDGFHKWGMRSSGWAMTAAASQEPGPPCSG